MSNKVKFQLKDGQSIRGIKGKVALLDPDYAKELEKIGIGFIIIDPDPFENLLKAVNNNDSEKVTLEVKQEPESIVIEEVKEVEPEPVLNIEPEPVLEVEELNNDKVSEVELEPEKENKSGLFKKKRGKK